MSFTDDDPLPSGTYAIVNAKYKQQVQVTFGGHGIVSTTSAGDHKWTLSYLTEKKQWIVQEVASQMFVDFPWSSENKGKPLAVRNPQHWIIRRRRFQHYLISWAAQPELCWKFLSSANGTNLLLSSDNFSDSSLWKLKLIETETPILDGSDGANPTVFHSRSSIYYRIYTPDNAVHTKRPAFLNDKHIGCIRSTWLTPPRDARSLRLFLSNLENIDPSKTSLFSSRSSGTALKDSAPIFLEGGQSLGTMAEDPLVLFSKTLPQPGIKPGTELFIVPPEGKSHLNPRFLFYGLYTEEGPLPSKAPVDPTEPWLSKINLDTTPSQPLSVADLMLEIVEKEDITEQPQSLLDEDGNILAHDTNVLMENGKWPGSRPQNCVMLKVPVPLSVTITGPVYYIYNCATNRALCRGLWGATQVVLHDRKKSKFTFELQKDGSLTIRSEFDKKYMGSNFDLQDIKHSFRFIRSTENKDWFSICRGLTRYQALHDADNKSMVYYIGLQQYKLEWRNPDANDPRQLWRLELAPEYDNRSKS